MGPVGEGGTLVQSFAPDGLRGLLQASEQEKEALGIRYTPQEISHQPVTWQTTYKILAEHRSELSSFLRRSAIDGEKENVSPIVYLVGAGTSDYIGRGLTSLLRRKWRTEVWAVPSTDLLLNLEDLVFEDRPALWVSFSRSGESSEGLAVLDIALKRLSKVRHIVITCNANSGMAALCREAPDRAMVVALDDAANDRGLAMTSSFTNMVIAGQCLAHVFSSKQYEGVFADLLRTGIHFLERATEVASALSKEGFSKACFVGSGSLRAVAQECALKILELTAGRIQTVSESTLGLRHGPMSALDRNTACISFLSQDPTRWKYEIDLVEEMRRKKLGKFLVAVTPESNSALRSVTDWELPLDAPNLRDEYRAPIDVMLGQLLGLFCSVRLGLKPDRPSPDDTISRVVSHVKIYR
jgi:D-galactosamine 6-phosphate deaminase/isomerase